MYLIENEQYTKLFTLMVNMGKKKVQESDAEDVASESLMAAMKRYDTKYGATFEQFLIGVIHPRRLNDKLKWIYRRKDDKSIDYIYHKDETGQTMALVNTREDKVGKIIGFANERLEAGRIDQKEYTILVMKANRHSNEDIAEKLELTPGRVSQIWKELKTTLENERS